MLSVSALAQSQRFNSEEDLVAHLQSIRIAVKADPIQNIEKVQPLIELSEKNDWDIAYLHAASLQIEALIALENTKTASEIYTQILPLAKALNISTIITRLMIAELEIKYNLQDKSDIKSLYAPLIQRADKPENYALRGEIYQAIGMSQYTLSESSNAIRSFKLAYDAFEGNGDLVGQTAVLNLLASAYSDFGQLDLAIELYQQSMTLIESMDDKFALSVVLYNLGDTYLKNQEFEQAEEKMLEAMQLSQDIDDYIGVAWAQSALSKVAVEKQEWKKALELADLSNPIFIETGDTESQRFNALQQASAYVGLGDLDQAKAKLALSKSLDTTNNSLRYHFIYYDLSAQIAFKEGKFKQAYLDIATNFDWLQQRYQDNTDKQIQRFIIEFDSQLKENKNQILEKENQINQLKIAEQQKQQTMWLISVGASLVIVVFVIALLIIQIKNRNRFKQMALRDDLTESPNRRAILQHAKNHFYEAKHTDMALTIAIADLDSFKALNDKFGHDVGDQVLKSFAASCATTLRKQDRFGRYGGEEWLLVFSDTKLSEIESVFERIRDELQATTSHILPDKHKVTFSMGVAQYDGDSSLQILIKRADEKLYQAKRQGRNQVVL